MTLHDVSLATGQRYLEFVRRLPQRTHFSVNVGASDGLSEDILSGVFLAGSAGLAIEPRFVMYEQLCRNLPVAVSKYHGAVTPDNVCGVFAAHSVPRRFDAIDIDIDGYDLAVTLAVLSYYRPALVSLEINEDIPPGIDFSVNYQAGHWWSGGPFYGCSIDAAVTALAGVGYELLLLDWHNLFMVRSCLVSLFTAERVGTATEAWLAGYWNRPGREQLYYWKDWTDQHYGRPRTEIMARLQKQFASHAGKFKLTYS